jgi:hypothetical protein
MQPPPPPSNPAFTAPPIYAKPGECYQRVVVPARFEPKSEQILKSAESERIEVTPPRFEEVEEQVLVKPAYEKVVEVIPAQYRTIQEQVLVKPASERLEQIPATYKTVEQQELIKPAHAEWKRGHGLIEKVDSTTGDILCLVQMPAEYRTVTVKVVDQPASTHTVPIPAEYATVTKQELVKEAEVRKETVPAEYRTVKTRKLVAPADEQHIPIPAQYQTVTRQVQVADSYTEWRQVLCETNATPEVIADLQRALRDAGDYHGPIDGRLGASTAAAVKAYQQANGLAQGGVTLETLQRLGVR